VPGVDILLVWNPDLDSVLHLAYDPDLADVRGRIVNPKIVTESPNKLFGVPRGAGFNIHPQELASPNICHL